MAKKYTTESDFKLLNSRLKRRIRDLLENKITLQTIAILSNELVSFSPEVKIEIIEYVTYLSEKLGWENPNSGIYASRAMERKGGDKTNQFYITQMKRILLDDQKKSKEGFYKQNNYISSNALFVEDVENDINNKTIELVNKYGNEEINTRYIIEADDEKKLSNVKMAKPKDNEATNKNSGIEELLRLKEEQERKDMEILRRQLAAQRLQEEQELLQQQQNKKNQKK